MGGVCRGKHHSTLPPYYSHELSALMQAVGFALGRSYANMMLPCLMGACPAAYACRPPVCGAFSNRKRWARDRLCRIEMMLGVLMQRWGTFFASSCGKNTKLMRHCKILIATGMNPSHRCIMGFYHNCRFPATFFFFKV